MSARIAEYAADHRYVLEQVARAAGITDPVAFEPDEFRDPLFRAARRGAFVPVDGVLIRDWDRALEQMRANRQDLFRSASKQVGFHLAGAVNGRTGSHA